MKHTVCSALLTLSLCAAAAQTVAAQANPSAVPIPSPSLAQTGDAAPPQKPSSLIAPAVDHLSQVVSQVQLEHWKAASRDETDSNLRSVERNVQSTLPDLVTTADAQPASVAASLPVLRNLDALCAVMIRVSVTARTNAPGPEAQALAGALTALQSARNTLADQVQLLAATQEKQLSTLTAQVATLTATPRPAAAPPPSAPAPKPHPKKKPTPKPKPAPQPAAAAKPVQPS